MDVYGTFEENNTAYMVMELLRGKTLGQLVEERGPLPEAEAIGYIRRVGEALIVVHEASLLHRDLKPDNIMLTGDGEVVLIDFGTARAFAAGKTGRMTTMVTPGYAPLEQYGQSVRFGPFTDVYALAATLYHVLTGQMPAPATDRASGVDLVPPRTLNPAVSAGHQRRDPLGDEHAGGPAPADRPRVPGRAAVGRGRAVAAPSPVTAPPRPRPSRGRHRAVPPLRRRRPPVPAPPRMPRPTWRPPVPYEGPYDVEVTGDDAALAAVLRLLLRAGGLRRSASSTRRAAASSGCSRRRAAGMCRTARSAWSTSGSTATARAATWAARSPAR